MASRGWVITGILGVGGLILTPMADSLVKEGKLPDWLAPKVDGFLRFFLLTTPWALWELMLIVLFIGGVAIFVVHRDSRTIALQANRIASLSSELKHRIQRCALLETANADLEASASNLKQSNTALEQQLSALSPAYKDGELSAVVFDMLAAVAMFADKDIRATLLTISSVMAIGNVEAHAAIDVLMERKFLARGGGVRGEYFQLTPAGRAYYLKHK
ncbi:hypothetical protein PS907_00597 [Pseudomonas fluorescens]|nr:hypothetical protein PS907_00597 [Pseudomonas fluorescens]